MKSDHLHDHDPAPAAPPATIGIPRSGGFDAPAFERAVGDLLRACGIAPDNAHTGPVGCVDQQITFRYGPAQRRQPKQIGQLGIRTHGNQIATSFDPIADDPNLCGTQATPRQ